MSGSPRTSARSTTRVSRTARTTWSRWSPRRWTCCAPPAPRTRPRTLRPLLTAALDNALDLRRRRADRPDRARRRQDGRARTSPTSPPPRRRRSPSYVAMARATANRAVARRPAAADPGRQAGRRARRRAGTRAAERPAARRRAGRVTTRDSSRRRSLTRSCPRTRRPGRARADDGRAARRPRRAAATARRDAGRRPVVVSIFVNPLQFGPGEDLDRYPRTLEPTWSCAPSRASTWSSRPTVDEVYPGGDPQVTVDPGPLGAVLEGARRPGHFRGVLTVVAKLFGLVRPDVAVFGEKDYQQLALIRRMVADLCLAVEVVGAADRARARRAGAVLAQPLPVRRRSAGRRAGLSGRPARRAAAARRAARSRCSPRRTRCSRAAAGRRAWTTWR